MNRFKTGDRVICMDASVGTDDQRHLILGCAYTVDISIISKRPEQLGMEGLRLNGVSLLWKASRFVAASSEALPKNPGWTKERIELARKLFIDQGLSASLVGKQLGVTRNAVIGVMNRRGHHRDQPSRPSDRLPDGRPPRAPEVKRAVKQNAGTNFRRVTAKPIPLPEPMAVATEHPPRPRESRRTGECAFPSLCVEGAVWSCCAPAEPDRQYCSVHASVVYQETASGAERRSANRQFLWLARKCG